MDLLGGHLMAPAGIILVGKQLAIGGKNFLELLSRDHLKDVSMD